MHEEYNLVLIFGLRQPLGELNNAVFDCVYMHALTKIFFRFSASMKAFLGLLFVVAALLAVSNAATYTSSFGFFDGRSIRFWNFGESTNGNSVIAQSYLVTITVPNTAVPSSVDGSTGEHQNLRCGNETCPLVVRSLFLAVSSFDWFIICASLPFRSSSVLSI